MNVIFSYSIEIGEECMSRSFNFTLHAEIQGFITIDYQASHPSRIEACRKALELFAMRATPREGWVSYSHHGINEFSHPVGPPNFIVDHLPDDEIKWTILQIIEIWKKRPDWGKYFLCQV